MALQIGNHYTLAFYMIRNFRLKTFNLLLFNCSRLEHGEGYAAYKHHKDKAK